MSEQTQNTLRFEACDDGQVAMIMKAESYVIMGYLLQAAQHRIVQLEQAGIPFEQWRMAIVRNMAARAAQDAAASSGLSNVVPLRPGAPS